MSEEPLLGDMPLDDFRRHGHELIDWIAAYLANPDDYPVLSPSQPDEIKSQLPASPPDLPEDMDDIVRDFEEIILPGVTHWNHPGFLAYFGITGSGPGILGELLASSLNVNAMLWRTSPAATELEETTVDWLRQMLGLPDSFRGVIMDTASISSLVALAAAREEAGLDIRQKGMAGRPELPRLRLYVSDQTHSSVEKAAITLGIGQEGTRQIPTNDAYQMDAKALAQAIHEDKTAGWRPFCVVATVGTTSTTSIDPAPEIAALCREHGLWLHIDGAYGGMAAIVPEMRQTLAGCEYADSLVVNPHKWLFTPIDCSVLYTRKVDSLRRAFSLVPDYLETTDGAVTNYMDWGIQLGRRFRALKLWMVIRHFGREGLAARIREHCRLGRQLAEWVDADPDFERLAPTPFSVVCFRAAPQDLMAALNEAGRQKARRIEQYLDSLNEAIIESVNQSGEVYLSHTRLRGQYTIRVAIGNIRTDEKIIRRAWELVRLAAARLDGEKRPSFDGAG